MQDWEEEYEIKLKEYLLIYEKAAHGLKIKLTELMRRAKEEDAFLAKVLADTVKEYGDKVGAIYIDDMNTAQTYYLGRKVVKTIEKVKGEHE